MKGVLEVVKGVYGGTRHREAYMRRRGLGGEDGERVSSSAFSCIPLCHGGRRPLRHSSSVLVVCTCIHRGGPRPTGLVALAERGEKERLRKTERKRRALCAHAVFIGYSGTRVPQETGVSRSFAQYASLRRERSRDLSDIEFT